MNTRIVLFWYLDRKLAPLESFNGHLYNLVCTVSGLVFIKLDMFGPFDTAG